MSEAFYLTLPSHSSLKEFPENKANNSKIRLPRPIHLEGSGWKVGLITTSLPDATIDLTRFETYDGPLLSCKWLLISSIDEQGVEQTEGASMNLKFEDILHDDNIVDGVSFMKCLVFKFDQGKNYKRPIGYLMETNSKKIVEFVFKWEGNKLVLDNSQLDLQ